jgi:hypothetical protein
MEKILFSKKSWFLSGYYSYHAMSMKKTCIFRTKELMIMFLNPSLLYILPLFLWASDLYVVSFDLAYDETLPLTKHNLSQSMIYLPSIVEYDFF